MRRKQKRLPRGAGILLPISALPSPYGIGTFGKDAYRFIDFLCSSGFSYWQVLPIGPTSYGDSPYQSFSAFAGNPYFIDLDLLIEEGLLTSEEVCLDWGDDQSRVDYTKLYKNRFQILRKAFSRSHYFDSPGYHDFCEEDPWLDDYAFYMALKMYFHAASWLLWPEEIRRRNPQALGKYRTLLSQEIEFWKFCQFCFFRQWTALKNYAHEKGVRIIGDLPIYVSLDSADVWTQPGLFCLDENLKPKEVAGVPPDAFSVTGQLWGNPLYNWVKMEEDHFFWWQQRIKFSAALFDVIRMDHFIGITRYYAIPYGEKTAQNGHWEKGPGEALLEAISPALQNSRLIAEDLGVVVPTVTRLRKSFGYPGMKVLQFAFDSGPKNPYLPDHYEQNCVVYCGTHDNETMSGFFAHQKPEILRFAKSYLGVHSRKELNWACIRAAYESTADLAIIQMQDFLNLGNEARMNYPSTIGGNWCWRLKKEQLSSELSQKLWYYAELYDRKGGISNERI
ncbi:4-alpha-glucanotransferase [Caproicibacterium sp. BJN0003]|uniref:4-alpha-glucanotransferase n=1 Tax=Caproicibacterium sp. BJN0003 TaxID=2994078 RepID=UPI00224FD27A|nr:4-alpha-glucanotransferase [Caproicibacterium sp. BJN0003]UZT81423.1 4-alpha-glucanotransferase [Caproicibacterium sp. BJN0003]